MIRKIFMISLLGVSFLAAQNADVKLPEDLPESVQEQEHVGRDIVSIYDSAVAHTEKVCDDYRRIKAIQLAKKSDISFEEAYNNITPVMPILKPIKRDLLRKSIYSPEDIVKHKGAVEEVKKQVEMMIDLTAKLLLEVEIVQQEMKHGEHEEQEKKLEDIVQQEKYDPDAEQEKGETRITKEQYQQLQEVAKEDEKERAKDLTPFMKRKQPDIQDLTKEDAEKAKKVKPELFKSNNQGQKLFGELKLENINKCVGRKIDEKGEPYEWMFVDTWYTIGPFPNPHRLNIHKKFPPETVVDLDATYMGKNGKEIAWEFIQTGEVKCVPANDEEYPIYYAYTEVYLDQPMDLWIAIGSDDKANVWLNGAPVWISGDKLKGWRFNEGFRKVKFAQGTNRLLYRVENGWKGTAFSLGIRAAK